MGLHANPNFSTAIRNAVDGIRHALKHERNLKIHATITVVVIMVALLFSLRRWEWVVLVFATGFVWSMELLNTAIEHAVDLMVGNHLHPIAKIIKDVAAGAVLVSTIVAVLIGIIVFVPRLFAWFF